MKDVEKYYQVFVSSTYLDLIEERQAVMQTLLKMDCLPIGMELFPNDDTSVWGLIQKLIDNCDLYVLIVAGRYGQVSEEDGISFTEKEYLYAKSINKPILIYTHKNPDSHNPKVNEKESPSNKEALATFRKSLMTRSVNLWSDLAELRANLAIDLASRLRTLEGGWTRTKYGVLDVFSDELRALEARFASSEINSLIKLLDKTLHEFKFDACRDRLVKLGEILPWLSRREWELLSDFARAQVTVRNWQHRHPEGNPAAEPMRQTIGDMVNHYQTQLRNFERGILEIDGEILVNKVSGYFMSAVRESFRALSNNDIAFWASDDSKIYYENNLKLLARGVRVERVFIVPKCDFTSEVFHKVVRTQVSDGIKARVISTESTRRILTHRHDRDFGIHDNFAVSFFRNYLGRSFRIDTTQETNARMNDSYEAVANSSEIVPGKRGQDRRLFEQAEEFNSWVESLTPAVPNPS